VTSLAAITLDSLGHQSPAIELAQKWLVDARGHESHWLWRWKFRTVDTKVRLDPDKFGWPWTPGTTSWVIPTSFALLALKRCSPIPRPEDVAFRIQRGTEMLFDRACPAGGWNAGNGVAFGVALAAHLDATAIALLALQDEKPNEVIGRGLDWLRREVAGCSSPFSLGWAGLALAAYQTRGAFSLGELREVETRLEASMVEPNQETDCSTLAVAALALQAVHGVNAFEVTYDSESA